MKTSIYTRHRFHPDIIRRAIWMYFRFNLSFRDVEELMIERGVDVSYETVRRWVDKFGSTYAKRIKSRSEPPSPIWHLDEVLSLIHISEPTRLRRISYAVFCFEQRHREQFLRYQLPAKDRPSYHLFWYRLRPNARWVREVRILILSALHGWSQTY